MKILCASLWENSWIPYWTKFFRSYGHEVEWLVGTEITKEKAEDKYNWADVVLSMWACGWAVLFSKWNKKPLFVIHRSFEIFEDTNVRVSVKDIEWQNVAQLFMLNETHYPLFAEKIGNVNPIFIKNGIDLDYFPTVEKRADAKHRIAWICNLNHKKGGIIALQAIAELRKIDKLVTLNHIGRLYSKRIQLYLKCTMPYLNAVWKNYGYNNSHAFVKNFLKTCRFILSTSIVEGHPMNILEAMAMGCKPLIHRYPGVEYQFPESYVWTTFCDLRRLYVEDYKPEEYRQFIADNYDYRKTYLPVLRAIEDYGK